MRRCVLLFSQDLRHQHSFVLFPHIVCFRRVNRWFGAMHDKWEMHQSNTRLSNTLARHWCPASARPVHVHVVPATQSTPIAHSYIPPFDRVIEAWCWYDRPLPCSTFKSHSYIPPFVQTNEVMRCDVVQTDAVTRCNGGRGRSTALQATSHGARRSHIT